MTPERERAVEQICQAALERPVAERARFVVEACGADAELRREVEALLAYANEASAFLQTPALAIAAQEVATRGPALTPGERVGSYTILAALGSGGMGDVFRARDAALGRDVAIKVLPPIFTNDTERLTRFEREARVLAALNHPNIAHIHGLADAHGVRAFVMELVDGPTLADRISRGPIPVTESLSIAKQIAEALEAAHEHGIIHRDLKPANIKVRPDGIVKVLDFGLAKGFNPRGATSDNDTMSPTMTLDATNAGVILGTPAYMAPEQARGQTIDKRSDIWAFGCFLYEMLTGRPPFEGEDLASTLASVLERKPDWTRLPANVPARVRDLLRLCLEKNPKNRRRDAGDLRIDIERALDPASETPAVRAPASRVAWGVAAVAILAVAVLTMPAIRYLRQTPAPSAVEVRREINPPPQSAPLEFALSPNDEYIVFVASGDGRRRLWLRDLNTLDAHPLEGTDGAAYPWWSPDSRSIGYFASRKLYRIDLDGGLPQPLADAALGGGGTWNADGTILFAPAGDARPLVRIDVKSGQSEEVTRLDPPRQVGHQSPYFLPDGRHFLFLAHGTEPGIYLGTLDGGAPKRLMASDVAAAYLEPNLVVFVQQGALMARRLDVERGELTGAAMTLADAVGYDVGYKRGAFSVSAAGSLLYQSGIVERDLFWVDRTTEKSSIVPRVNAPDVNRVANPDVSRDGQVTMSVDSQKNVDIWTLDPVGGRSTRLTNHPELDAFSIWSPDATRIVFSSRREGKPQIYITPSTSGPGSETLLLRLLEGESALIPADWSRDGRFLLYTVIDANTGGDLWMLDMKGNRWPVVNTPAGERNGQFSPDGQWLAYETNETGRPQIWVAKLSDPTDRRPVSTSGGMWPRWHPKGEELYFIAPDAKLMAVPITTRKQANGSKIGMGTPVALFQTQIFSGSTGAGGPAQYAVGPDARRFLIIQPAAESTTSPLTLLLNWKAPASPELSR